MGVQRITRFDEITVARSVGKIMTGATAPGSTGRRMPAAGDGTGCEGAVTPGLGEMFGEGVLTAAGEG